MERKEGRKTSELALHGRRNQQKNNNNNKNNAPINRNSY